MNKTLAKSHMEFVSPVFEKISTITSRTDAEMSSMRKRSDQIDKALLNWRGKAAVTRPHLLLKIPDGKVFTHEELDLAGWALELAYQEKITYKEAVIRILDRLKQDPDELKAYTGDAAFGEASNHEAVAKRARAYKYRMDDAGKNISFAEAVDAVTSGGEFAEVSLAIINFSGHIR